MFLNNFGGVYRTNWQTPFLGQNVLGNSLGHSQNVFGTPFGFGQNAFGGQVPYLWNQVPFASQFGTMPCYYTVGNIMGQLLPQTVAQPINALNAGFPSIPFTNATLGYGINNTIGQGFSPLASTFQNPILGCC